MISLTGNSKRSILFLLLIDISILILTAFLRNQYIVFHFVEIIFFGFLIFLLSNSIKDNIKEEEKIRFIFTSALFIYSALWLSGVLILNRVQVELARDFNYAILLIIFLFTIVLFLLLSAFDYYSNRVALKSYLNIVIITWIIIGGFFLLATLLLAPQDDLLEFIMKIEKFF